MTEGLPKIIQPREIYSGCLMSKQTRKRFPAQSNYRAEQVLDLIHGDLCGPILPETSGGNKYFLLLVDDYSRAMWVYFLKTKDEAFDAFKKFRAQVERDPDKRVKNFRTNREASSVRSSAGSGQSSEPRNFRLISEIYDDTEEVEAVDELMLMWVDEPINYSQSWRELKELYPKARKREGKESQDRLTAIAKGYGQQYGVDFKEIFALVTHLETMCLLLELSPKNGWMFHYLDVKSAFLNGDLEEDVYVSRPEGFEKSGQKHLVYKLSKVLYGLCQAPKAWYLKLRKCLESMGLSRCPYEHAVYIKR
ncbi:uncharacterized protein LOC141705624 [Apium graveolens]|uniref:uncharacterized protein LOC141705624 n=1 Tax=Apium graveolens TaxID=4045 RepID=UPI003D7BBFD6